MTTTQPRQPAGVPVGGQFAPSAHPRPGFELDAEPAPPPLLTGPLTAAHPAGTLRIERSVDTDRFVGRCERCVRPIAVDDPSGGSSRRRVACPECGRQVVLQRIVGVVTSLQCNTACESAAGPLCECSCGGSNHSGRYVASGYELSEAVEAFRAATTKRRAAAAKASETRRRNAASAKAAALDAWRAAHGPQAAWMERNMGADGSRAYVARSMSAYLERRGQLTEAQLAFIDRLDAEERAEAERAAQAAANPPAPAPTGTTEVVGEIVSIRTEPSRFSYYGSETKMLVVSEAGWKVWVTKPRALVDARTGDRVRFVADLERSEDEAFAFGRRPRRAEMVPAD